MNRQHFCLPLILSFAAFAAGQVPSTVYQPPATAQSEYQPAAMPAPPPASPPVRSAAALEKLAAPIALYPDPLIAVMLPASAYPVEIVLAARFVADTNNLAKLDDQGWDENVKAVARIPTAIQKMEKELSWTTELGQAFIEQPQDLMDAIQGLRAKAQDIGMLRTTEQQIVVVTNAVVERIYETQIVYVTNTVVQIQPATPQVIYVPVYDPSRIYYVAPHYVGPPPVMTFALGIAIGAAIANNHCDWHYGAVYHGHGTVVIVGGSGHSHYYPPPPGYRPPAYHPPPGYRPPPPGYRPPGYPSPAVRPPTLYSGGSATAGTSQRWQPDQSRLRANGTPGSEASVGTMEARGWGSGGNRPTTQPEGVARTMPSTASPSLNRPPQATPNISRPDSSSVPAVNRSAPPSNSRESAFSNLNGGASERASGNRGASSRGGNSGFGGGRGGGR